MRGDLYFSAMMCLRGGKQGDFCRSTDVDFFFLLYFPLHLALFWEYANNPWNVWHQRSLINISQFHCAAFGSEIEQHSTFSLRTRTMQIEAAICCTQQEPRAASWEWEWRKVPLLMKELKYYTDYREGSIVFDVSPLLMFEDFDILSWKVKKFRPVFRICTLI